MTLISYLICCRHCCGSCNGDHDWYGYSNHACYMEDKHMVDFSVLCGVYFHRGPLYVSCDVQIHSGWLSSLNFVSCSNDNNGDVALRTQTKVYD